MVAYDFFISSSSNLDLLAVQATLCAGQVPLSSASAIAAPSARYPRGCR
jgi:hypothetical protein